MVIHNRADIQDHH